MPSFTIRTLAVATLALCVLEAYAQPQNRIYRCGKDEYLNDAQVAKARGCVLFEGGNITIIEGTRPTPQRSTTPTTTTRSGSSTERVDSVSQRARDSDARVILEAELRKAEERLAQARKEYANGEPEKQGIESRNYQRYLDRVADLKAAVSRAEGDVTGLQKELGRLPASANAVGSAAK